MKQCLTTCRFVSSTAFRLWEQESLHLKSWSHQRPLWAQQRWTLQGHSYGEDCGRRFWWTSRFLQTHVLTGSEWKCPHRHGYRDSHRQGSRLHWESCQVRELMQFTVATKGNFPSSGERKLEKEKEKALWYDVKKWWRELVHKWVFSGFNELF